MPLKALLLVLLLAGCAAPPPPAPDAPATPTGATSGTESILVDQAFTVGPGHADKVTFEVPAAATASRLRIVLETGAHDAVRFHGPGQCQDFAPNGDGTAPAVQVESGKGAEARCGPLPSGTHTLSWEGTGTVAGRVLFAVTL